VGYREDPPSLGSFRRATSDPGEPSVGAPLVRTGVLPGRRVGSTIAVDRLAPSVPFRLETPETPEAAVRMLADAAEGTVTVVAGGTDLLLDLDAGRTDPSTVLSLRRLPWAGISWSDTGVRIGSLRSLRDVELSNEVVSGLPGLHEAVRAVGSVPLRRQATLGGNIVRGSSASDLLPILLALEAKIGLFGPEGARVVALDELLDRPRRPRLRPGELLAWIDLPRVSPSAFAWQRVRPANDISQVSVAAARSRDGTGWRIALGGVPGVPRRLPEVEQLLNAPLPSDAAIEAAGARTEQVAPFGSDRRASAPYRLRVAGVLARRAIALARSRIPASGGTP
jgi:xanthine dehydrogenase FAD-binding subunit